VDTLLADLFSGFDSNGDGSLTYKEFSEKLQRLDVDRDDRMPEQLHLSLTGIDGEMMIKWITYSAVSSPFVEFWEEVTLTLALILAQTVILTLTLTLTLTLGGTE
jgi:hypothetical protein